MSKSLVSQLPTGPAEPAERAPTDWKTSAMQKRIRRRYARERRFRFFGLAAVVLSASFLAFLLITMVANGWRGFTRTDVALPIDFPAAGMLIERAQLDTPAADLASQSLWASLRDGVESIRRFTDEELVTSGLDLSVYG